MNTLTIKTQKPVGLVLAELVAVVTIIGLLLLVSVFNISGAKSARRFKSQANELAFTLQRAVRSAAKNNNKYSIIINVAEQSYILRHIKSTELYEISDEKEIIFEKYLTPDCQIDYVEFDDAEGTDEQNSIAHFVAARQGFQAGGKIALFDAEGNEYSIIINRLSRIVELRKGFVELLPVEYRDELPF